MEFLAQGGRMGIGSDSHVSLSVVEELRWLEYGQRLRDQRRNRLYRGDQPRSGAPCTPRWRARPGAGAANRRAGRGQTCRLAGARRQDPYLAIAEDDAILNRWLFAGGDRQVRDVMVNGQWVVRQGRHAQEERRVAFAEVLRQLLG